MPAKHFYSKVRETSSIFLSCFCLHELRRALMLKWFPVMVVLLNYCFLLFLFLGISSWNTDAIFFACVLSGGCKGILSMFSILPSIYFSLSMSEWFQWMDLWVFFSVIIYRQRDTWLKLCNYEEAFHVLILIGNVASLSSTLWKLLKGPNRTVLYLRAHAEDQWQDKSLCGFFPSSLSILI